MPSRTTRSEAARPRAGSRGSFSNQLSAGGKGSGVALVVGAVLGADFGGGGPGLKGRGGGGGGCVEWAARRRMVAMLEGRKRIGGIVRV